MKKSMLLLLAVASLLSACNTFHGMGQDMEDAGQAVSNSAKKVQDKM